MVSPTRAQKMGLMIIYLFRKQGRLLGATVLNGILTEGQEFSSQTEGQRVIQAEGAKLLCLVLSYSLFGITVGITRKQEGP